MGVRIETQNNELELNIFSVGGLMHQSQNIIKMLEASEKPIKVNMDSMVSSMQSFIRQDMYKNINKLFDYEY